MACQLHLARTGTQVRERETLLEMTMRSWQHRSTLLTAIVMLAWLPLVAASPASSQTELMAAGSFVEAGSEASGGDQKNALERGRYAVLVDLDENMLHFKQGDLTLWSAPVGTGTGMRVITDSDDWRFATPTGRFTIKYKERDPVWIAPDWFFVENNLPVPSTNHPSRYMKGTLGAAAVYISPDLAIHGTDRPELLGERVSHGCIRLENRYALRLYHSVQVGTEVIIVGGKDVEKNARVVDLREGYDPSLASSGNRRPPPVDPLYERWKRMPTSALLDVLDKQLEESEESRWDQVAILLLERARTDDDKALVGLLERSRNLPTVEVEREWATFLVDAYRRSSLRTVEALSQLDLRSRRHAAAQIVSGSMTLFGGNFNEAGAPWPTARIPEAKVPREGRRGWDALTSAERDHRNQLTMAADL
jgi:hypothetical protein